MARRPPYTSISTETPVSGQKADHFGNGETGGKCDQSFAATMDMGEVFLVTGEDGVVVLVSGAAANLACLRLLAHHNRMLDRYGIQRVSAYPSKARFRFGDGWLAEVRHSSDIPVGMPGIGALPRRLRRARIFQLHRAKAPWGHWASSCDFYADPWFCTDRGRRTPEGGSSGTLFPALGRFSQVTVEEHDMSRGVGPLFRDSSAGSGSVRWSSSSTPHTGRPVSF